MDTQRVWSLNCGGFQRQYPLLTSWQEALLGFLNYLLTDRRYKRRQKSTWHFTRFNIHVFNLIPGEELVLLLIETKYPSIHHLTSYLFIHLSIYLPTYLFTYQSIYLLIYLLIYLPTYLSIYLPMALRPFVGPWPLFSFLIFYTASRRLLGQGFSPSQGRYLHIGQHKHRKNAHRYPFEPTIPVFEWAKTVHALDGTATVIGDLFIYLPIYLSA
jgi:hypothetical protein